MSMSVSVVVSYSAQSRSLWCAVYAGRTRKEKFSGPGELQRNMTDLAGSLVASCRPPGRLQKMPDDRTWNASVAVRTADGSRRTADAGDEQCLRCGCSSPSCTAVLCAADIDDRCTVKVTGCVCVIRDYFTPLRFLRVFPVAESVFNRRFIRLFYVYISPLNY